MTSISDKVFLLSRRWPNHAGHSGYDLLGRYVGRPLSSNPIPDFLLPDRFVWRLQRYMRGYDRTSIALELLAARHMATHQGCLYHILYGDNCFNFLSLLNGRRGHRIIASYHHPPQILAEFVQKREIFKQLSAVIIVGKNQFSAFEGVYPRERIYFVPHPVDTSHYLPPSDFSERENNLCLFVGAHLRDLRTLCSIIEDAHVLAPHLRFAVVAYPRYLGEFEGLVGNFTIYTEIDDNELLRLYQKATLLVLPLLDSTANNTILEAMSCGLPMVVTNVGGVQDYVNEDWAYLVPPYNPRVMLEAILYLMDSPKERKRMSASSRKQALTFDWHVIAKQIGDVYLQVLGIT